jgi:hypothetical protein
MADVFVLSLLDDKSRASETVDGRFVTDFVAVSCLLGKASFPFCKPSLVLLAIDPFWPRLGVPCELDLSSIETFGVPFLSDEAPSFSPMLPIPFP